MKLILFSCYTLTYIYSKNVRFSDKNEVYEFNVDDTLVCNKQIQHDNYPFIDTYSGFEKNENNTSSLFEANINDSNENYQNEDDEKNYYRPYFSFNMPIGFSNYKNTIVPFVIGNTIISCFKLKYPNFVIQNKGNKDFVTMRVYNHSTTFRISTNNESFVDVVTCFLKYLLEFCHDEKFLEEAIITYKRFKTYNYIINKYTVLRAIQDVKDEKKINVVVKREYHDDMTTKDMAYLYFSSFKEIDLEKEKTKLYAKK